MIADEIADVRKFIKYMNERPWPDVTVMYALFSIATALEKIDKEISK